MDNEIIKRGLFEVTCKYGNYAPYTITFIFDDLFALERVSNETIHIHLKNMKDKPCELKYNNNQEADANI